ncbi:MAG: hypothetical protein MJZ16_14535 [Bacteroidales bacterium]|nr:hypothetical protein [Bacteroidales bacterium]
MCPPPCGPRRPWRCRPSVVASQRITKAEVDRIIDEESIDCSFKFDHEPMLQPYEGCLQNLHRVLHDGATKVKVVGSRSDYYVRGKRTIEMDAPCFPATIIIRTEN